MASPADYPWTMNLVWKLLHNDPGAVSLFAKNPFPNRPPRYIRAVRYRYWFATPGNAQGRWWQRERADAWLVPVSAQDPRLRRYLHRVGWLP